MKKHNVFLLFTSLTALLFCACSSELKEKENNSSKPGTVTLSIANDTQRTISPASDISYTDVSKWTVTFKDITESRSEKYNDIVKTVSFSESANQQIQLPLGTYAVIFKGDVIKQVTTGDETSEASTKSQTVPFYGESTVTVEDGKSASVSVFVSPKKSADGTGSFNYIVNIDGIQDCPPSTATETQGNYFAAKLIQYNTENEIALNYSVNPQQDNGNIYTLTVTNDSVKSGFYQLSIKYIWETYDSEKNQITKDKEIFYPYHDFLVEIVDGLPTNGSVDITVSLEDSKTYYATTGETKGNGAFESLPKNLDELLDDIKDPTISKADIYDIYMVDKIDLQNQSYPEIDVSKVNEAGKTYNISTISDGEPIPCYRITGAGEGNYPTIVPFVNIINLKDNSSVPGKTLNVRDIYGVLANGLHLVLKNSTSVAIDYSSTNIIFPVYLDNTDSFEYYLENPFIIATNVPENSEFVGVTNSKYTIIAKSISDTETGYCIIPVSSANPSINGIDFSLKATKNGAEITTETKLYANDTVVITATPAAEATFAQDTTFAWFVNGKQVEANKDNPQSCSIQFGVTEGSGVDNRIICLVGYNGEYATVQTTLTAVEQTALLYTKYGLGYAELASLNANPNLSWILSDAIISDFCIDTKTNDAYIIYGNTYIRKATYYHAKTDMHYEPVDYFLSELNLIRKGNDDKLYVKFSSNNDGNVFGIVDLLPTEPGTQGEASTSQYLIMNEVSSTDQIMSFCVDDAGIMYITYKDSESNILLEKFLINAGVLTKDKSITLAMISSIANIATSTYFNGISSALKVTDMHYEDGYIYLLVRDVFIDYSTPTDTVRSLGGVCKIKANDLTLADNANPLIGWANTTLKTTTGDTGTVYNYKHAENESSKQFYFYGPQKIIAIKPKEIVIADDGASIEDSKMCNQNRVVLFNLETNSITGVKTSPTEFYFSTSGTNYTP